MLLTLIESGGGGGFNPLGPSMAATFFWTVVIFLLCLIPVWKLVMGPTTRALIERDREASEAVKLAERAGEEAEKARAEVEIKLGEAQTEAAALLSGARERAEKREREIVEAAKGEAQALVENARVQIKAEQDKAISAIRTEVVDLSLAAAGQVLAKKVDSDDDRRLAEQLIKTN